MARAAEQESRKFSVTEANAMLPLVRAIVEDLVRLTREVIDRHDRVEHLKAGREIISGDPYDEELSQIEEELAKDRARLYEYVEELRQLGVEPKSADQGIVDFPSEMNGSLVYLCWQLGEPEVMHWHSIDGGFRGRHPLEAQEVVSPSLGEAD